MSKIRLAIVGLGNCASSLLQGVEYYRRTSQDKLDGTGLMHMAVGPYRASDIEVVAAFDTDRRKVGKPVGEAIYAPPNNTFCICPQLKDSGPIVQMKDVNAREEIEQFLQSLRPVAKMKIDEPPAPGPPGSGVGHPSAKAATTHV